MAKPYSKIVIVFRLYLHFHEETLSHIRRTEVLCLF